MEKAGTIICWTVFKLPNHFINYPDWKAELRKLHCWSHIMLICFVGENKDMSCSSHLILVTCLLTPGVPVSMCEQLPLNNCLVKIFHRTICLQPFCSLNQD